MKKIRGRWAILQEWSDHHQSQTSSHDTSLEATPVENYDLMNDIITHSYASQSYCRYIGYVCC